MNGYKRPLLVRIFARESMKKVAQTPDNIASKRIIFIHVLNYLIEIFNPKIRCNHQRKIIPEDDFRG
jgi:hypothetical protein